MTLPLQAAIEQFDLPHPSGTGNFRISVARHPSLTPETKDVPVLYVLDADMSMAIAAELARLRGIGGMMPTVMVVGIGYGAASFEDFAKLRTGDLTPPLSDSGKEAQAGMAKFIGDQQGGAEAFLTFLTDVLRPAVLSRYPEASADDHSIFGHSLGGLFVAFALLTRPQAFRTFLSSSPSLWWDGFAILQRLDAFAETLKGLEHKPRAYIMIGGKEQDVPKKAHPIMNMTLEEIQAMVISSRMVDAAEEFGEALKQAGLTDVRQTTFADEDHGSVVPAALMRGIAFAAPEPE